MADEQPEANAGNCYRCGDNPHGEDGVLCTPCFDYLANRPASEIYAVLPSAAA
ncbi:hypothetical protein [Amycolatopsis sp. NPDC054798]